METLTEEQLGTYREYTESLLERTGFRVQHAELRARASAAGAIVDDAAELVRLPRTLTRELLAQAPSQYDIHGVTGRRWTLGGDHRHAVAIVTDPWILDSDSHQPRRPCLADVQRHTRIAQGLDEVAAISLMDFPVTDVSGAESSLHAMEAHVLEHDKHMMVMAANPSSLERWLRLLPILCNGQAPVGRVATAGVAVLSPLTLSHDNGELLLLACANDLPVVPTVCPMAGTTAPYSKAAILLQANAEAVFMAAMTQIVRPGHPFLHVIGPSRTDMRDGGDLYYTLDKVLWKTAGAQLGRAYGLPTGAECGGTATCTYGVQSGAEGAQFMSAAWRSGAHWLAGFGSCGNAICMSAEMMVIHSAWLRAAKFLDRGLDVPSAADLASIEANGPGAHFLADELTLKGLRTGEFFTDPLFDYDGGHMGSRPMLEQARAQADELAARSSASLPDGCRDSIRAFFRSERAALSK
jgi:trimethylamine---corrinoid protein Co-methyltransferase